MEIGLYCGCQLRSSDFPPGKSRSSGDVDSVFLDFGQKEKARQIATNPSISSGMMRREAFIKPRFACSQACRGGLHALGGRPTILFRDERLVCVGEHKQSVRTIELILFKYSRVRHVQYMYTLLCIICDTEHTGWCETTPRPFSSQTDGTV